jgi:hypothetical protein
VLVEVAYPIVDPRRLEVRSIECREFGQQAVMDLRLADAALRLEGVQPVVTSRVAVFDGEASQRSSPLISI